MPKDRPSPAWEPAPSPDGQPRGEGMVFFAAPPEGFGPIRAALTTLGRESVLPDGGLAWKLFRWGEAPDLEAVTAFLSPDALHWATWRPGEGVQTRTIRFSEVREIRFEVIDDYERKQREQPTRVWARDLEARTHSFGLTWIGLDGACTLGHHQMLETAAKGFKPFLEDAMEAYTDFHMARLPDLMARQGYVQVGLGHAGWIRLHDQHLELKADEGPVHAIPTRAIRVVRLWEQKKWILEVDDPPATAPFFGSPLEVPIGQVGNLALLMQVLEARIRESQAAPRKGQQRTHPGTQPPSGSRGPTESTPTPEKAPSRETFQPQMLDLAALDPRHRARILEGLRGPAVIVADERLPGSCFGMAAWLLAPLAAGWLLHLGYGEVGELLIHAPWAVLLHALPVAALLFGLLAILRSQKRFTANLPPQGTFLTAAHALRIRGPRIEAFPLEAADKLVRVQIHNRRHLEEVRLDVHFGRTILSAPLGTPDQACERWERLELARARHRTALNQHHGPTLADLDPLLPLDQVPEPLRPAQGAPLPGTLPFFLRPAVLRLPVWGLALGLAWPLMQLRNRWSDAKAFEALQPYATRADLEAYVKAGGWHGREVQERMIPEAALREARLSPQRARALRQVARDYPSVAPRAQVELHRDLLAQRDRMRATVPQSPWKPAFEALFEAALQGQDAGLTVRFAAPGLSEWVRRQRRQTPEFTQGLDLLDLDHPRSRLWKETALDEVRKALQGVLGEDLIPVNGGHWVDTLHESRGPCLDVVIRTRINLPHLEGRHGKTLLLLVLDSQFQVTLRVPGCAPATFTWWAPHHEEPTLRPDRVARRLERHQTLRSIGQGGPFRSDEPDHPWFCYGMEEAWKALRGELGRRWG